ncbi:MAG: hypothetical protein FWB85_08135, partial [Chitinispirillia bacterium]|nr:hypothetical protein [Chitinispirillia bacterium]MCL2242277.1 hypothetical protein [Chitinispirillia bacterium]
NYDAGDGSVCYDSLASNCDTYGRLYDWATVMDGASSSESSPSGVQGVCPVGWHVPSGAEWTMLDNFVGSSAGNKLKSATGWEYYNASSVGTDDYGFSALPGGYGYSGGYFYRAGYYGNWWSATEYGASYAWYRLMYYYYDDVLKYNYTKTHLFSLRCVRDSAAPQ